MNQKILILGGTRMVGRDFVEYILTQNHNDDIYIANRGVTNPDLFKNRIKHLYIDRSSGIIYNLQNLHFNIVIDFSCYNLDDFKQIYHNISCDKYIFISSACVEDIENNNIHLKKSDKLYEYCKIKKEIEDYSSIYHNVFNIRPWIIYGKYDYTGRFYEKNNIFYWKHNNARVLSAKELIHVRKFTIFLHNYLNSQNYQKTVVVDRDGIHSLKNNIEYRLHPYEANNIDIKKFDTPFKHIVIDNLFNSEIYESVCNIFPSFIAKTIPYKDQKNATSNYNAYIYGLSKQDFIKGYDFFVSSSLQKYIEKEFDIKTNDLVSTSAHLHKAPSINGFVHKDLNIVSFNRRSLLDDSEDNKNVIYANDSIENGGIKTMRSIALIYYLNNSTNDLSIGGGTGIYTGYNGDLIKTIEPKNNRLFIFEITPNSYHGYIGSNYDRSCIVSWFHSSPAYIISRFWKFYRKNPKNFIERWPLKNEEHPWEWTQDPEYHKYFNFDVNQII